jgi:hypothetical protein
LAELSGRIVSAKQAIAERLQELEGSENQEEEEERTSLADAASGLAVLEAELSKYLPQKVHRRCCFNLIHLMI